jgi:hypothetical protein
VQAPLAPVYSPGYKGSPSPSLFVPLHLVIHDSRESFPPQLASAFEPLLRHNQVGLDLQNAQS